MYATKFTINSPHGIDHINEIATTKNVNIYAHLQRWHPCRRRTEAFIIPSSVIGVVEKMVKKEWMRRQKDL